MSKTDSLKIFNSWLYIETYYYSGISTYLLSEMADMSEKKYTARFVKIFGMTPKQYLLMCRLNNVCNYLITTKYSISKISDLCGFTSLSYFHRAFKKTYEMTPSEFRYRQLQKNMI
jgi:AraC-type DNA-binding domain-containing proteins